MNLLGLHFQLLIGATVPTPAPLKLNEALQSVEVTQKDEGQSGFQLVFQIGRSTVDLMDYSLLKNPLIQPFNRVILNVLFGITPQVIMDGIITKHALAPSDDPGSSKLTLTGEDVSVMMDLEQESRSFPALSDNLIVLFILLEYLVPYGVIPNIEPLSIPQVRTPDEQTTTQPTHTTDLAYIKSLAEKQGYVFYLEPGLVPGTNTAYWGPPNRRGLRQGALSVNMGPNTNVETISFQYNGLAANQVTFTNEDGSERTLDQVNYSQPILPLASRIETPRKRIFLTRPDGLNDSEVEARAQGQVNKSFNNVVTATGTLDALRYGRILKPRGLVDLRGAGASYDGTFYVKSVTHKIDIRKGEYKQSFTLEREGIGTTTPFVST